MTGRLLLEDGDHCTEDEYLAFCDQSEERWEFIPDNSPPGILLRMGIIRAMAGGTLNHNLISGNLITALNISFRGVGNQTCRVVSSDQKVLTAEGCNTFSDVSVICGRPEYPGTRRDAVTNPILVAEVLSPSTEDYDRSEKLRAFQTIPALEFILFIDASAPSIEVLTLEDERWESALVAGLDSRLALPALGIELALAEVYALVDFNEGAS